MAAPVDISFDFTTGGSANSRVKPGNIFAYTNTGSADYKMLVNAWSEEKSGYQAATVVNASADYSSVGYKSVATLKGLGTCSAGDSAFNKCLSYGDEFAVDGKKSSEWVVMMLDKPLDISSFQINQAGSGAGKLAY